MGSILIRGFCSIESINAPIESSLRDGTPNVIPAPWVVTHGYIRSAATRQFVPEFERFPLFPDEGRVLVFDNIVDR